MDYQQGRLLCECKAVHAFSPFIGSEKHMAVGVVNVTSINTRICP